MVDRLGVMVCSVGGFVPFAQITGYKLDNEGAKDKGETNLAAILKIIQLTSSDGSTGPLNSTRM